MVDVLLRICSEVQRENGGCLFVDSTFNTSAYNMTLIGRADLSPLTVLLDYPHHRFLMNVPKCSYIN